MTVSLDSTDDGSGSAQRRQPPTWRTFFSEAVRGLALPLLVALVALAVRIAHLAPIENDGDAIRKWYLVKQYLHGTTPEWNHHAARLTINVPLYLVQSWLGTSPGVYYVLPVAVGTLMAVVTYALGKRLGGVGAGTIAAILVIAFPEMERAGSQLLPGGFVALFVGLSVYGVVRHAERSNPWWLVFAAVSLFLGYLARVTALFFLPGLVLATWLARKRPLDVVVLLAPLAALFFVELTIYHLFTDFTYGRISVIQSSHGTKSSRPASFALASARFRKPRWYWQMCLNGLIATVPAILVLWRPRLSRVPVLVTLSFLLFLVFPTRGFSSARALSHHERYFVDGLIPMLVVHAAFGAAIVRQWAASRDRGITGAALRFLRRRLGWCMGLLVGGYCALSLYGARDRLDEQHPLGRLRQETALLTDAYQRGIPIVATSKDRKALDVVRYVQMPDEALLDEATGKFEAPPTRRARRKGKSYYVVAKGLSSKQIAAQLKKRCYVEFKRVTNLRRSRNNKMVFAGTGEKCGRRPR